MTIADWCDKFDRDRGKAGSRSFLSRSAVAAYKTIMNLVEHGSTDDFRIAASVCRATGGKVTMNELFGPALRGECVVMLHGIPAPQPGRPRR